MSLLDHRWSFQAQAPAINAHLNFKQDLVLRNLLGYQHLSLNQGLFYKIMQDAKILWTGYRTFIFQNSDLISDT